MKILVTGAAGFLGSHLCDALVARGDTVYGIDNLSTGKIGNIQHLIGTFPDNGFHFLHASVTAPNFDWLYERCDQVYHLASSVGVRRIIDRPVEAVRNIVNTTDAVLVLCNRYHKPVLITSTSEVYGHSTAIPFREDENCSLGPTSSPRWSYAAAKMVDEFLGLAYYRETGLPVRIVRLFNTVGPRQTGQYGMVVPTFVAQAQAGRTITVHGNGKQTRCFASVHDIVPGLMALMDCEKAAGKVVNLGTDEEVSINVLAELVQILVLLATDPDTIGEDDPAFGIWHYSLIDAYGIAFDDMLRRVPDLTRARELIGWKPKWGLKAILVELIRAIAG